MGMVELFVPIAAIGGFVVMVGLITRLIATAMLNKTIREALRSDPGSVALLADRLEARQPWADALLGYIFIAFAVALLVLGLTEADPLDRREMLRAVTVPAIVGGVVLLFTRSARRRRSGSASSR